MSFQYIRLMAYRLCRLDVATPFNSQKRMGKLRKGPLSELTRWRRGTILKSRKFRLRAVQSLDNRASLLSEPGHAWGDVTRNLLNFLADGACGGAAATARAGQSSP
jgi:hypothetical protein